MLKEFTRIDDLDNPTPVLINPKLVAYVAPGSTPNTTMIVFAALCDNGNALGVTVDANIYVVRDRLFESE